MSDAPASRSLELAFACPGCGKSVEGTLAPGTSSMTCPSCSRETALADPGAFERCPVCATTDLYAQRDFNRKLGLLVVAVGLGLGPFTSWISVGVAVLLDAALYLVVPSVAICYACSAQMRGFPRGEGPGPFDIAVHDAYKFAKRFPPVRGVAVAGPLASRLRAEGREVKGF